MRGFLSVFGGAFRSFQEDKTQRLGAALAYYTVLSIPPLLIVLIAIAGTAFGRDAVQDRVVRTIEQLIGAQGALAIHEVLRTTRQPERGLLASAGWVLTLLVGASGVFIQLKDALNTIWEVEPKPGRGFVRWLRKYLFSMMLLLGTGFLMIVSLAVNAVLAALGEYLARLLPGSETTWLAINFAVSLGVIAAMFAVLFRYIPDGRVAWRVAMIGGGVTSLLFMVGETAIGLYLGRSHVGSAFGAAGSLVVLLVWVYYSSLIFLFGAEFTKEYAARLDRRVRPDPGAARVTEHARQHQGIPHARRDR